MDESSVERTLAACEQQLRADGTPDLRALGFWRAVAAVKRHPELVDRYATRIAAIDRAVFRRRVRLRSSASFGLGLLAVATFAGTVLIALARGLDHPWREIVLLAGTGALDVCTHGLAHFVVGAAVGIRFTDWFIDLPKRPQPGLKVDYASYLRASPRQRAWMHAAGAIATKVVPFLVIHYALAIGTDLWVVLALLALGVVQVVFDVLYSVRASDWKKFRREMRLAR